MLDDAYDWLCRRRREAPFWHEFWDLRWRWDDLKPRLQTELLAGTFRLGAPLLTSWRWSKAMKAQKSWFRTLALAAAICLLAWAILVTPGAIAQDEPVPADSAEAQASFSLTLNRANQWYQPTGRAYFHGAVLYPDDDEHWILESSESFPPMGTAVTKACASFRFNAPVTGWYVANLQTRAAAPGMSAWLKDSGTWVKKRDFAPGQSTEHPVELYLSAGWHSLWYTVDSYKAYVTQITVHDFRRSTPDVLFGGQGSYQAEVCVSGGQVPPSFTCSRMPQTFVFDLAIADLDGQGDLDFAYTSNEADKACFSQREGGYTCLKLTSIESNVVKAGDMNGDGLTDLVYGGRSPNPILSICLNQGSGTFSCLPAGPLNGRGAVGNIALADLDGAGGLDIAVARGSYDNYGKQDYICLNDGSGSVTCAPAPGRGDNEGAGDVEVADLDGLHGLDIIWAPDELALSNGAGGYTVMPLHEFTKIELGDFNSDGYVDVIRTNRNGAGANLCLNDGSASFTCQPNFDPESEIKDLAVGDLDGDGDPDVAIAKRRAASRICLNEAGSFTCQDAPTIGNDHWTVAIGDLSALSAAQ